MLPLAQVGPDTGLPDAIETVLAVLFYLGPLGFAAIAAIGCRRRRSRLAVAGLILVGGSLYTEIAFLDLGCSHGDDGCAWLDSQGPLPVAAGVLAAAGAVLAAREQYRPAALALAAALAAGLWVTWGYLIRVL